MSGIRMIVTDLDGTLLRSDRTLSAHTVEVLRRCRARGIKTAVATARSAQAAEKFLAQCAPDAFIGYGGALVKSGGHILHRFEIPAERSDELTAACLALPDTSAVYASHETFAYTNDRAYTLLSDSAHYQACDFSPPLRLACLKISLINKNPASVAALAERFPELDMLRYSGENLYRFAHRKALKWDALAFLASHYGIAPADIAAFGDDVNDLGMLRGCGVGVAVANAIDEVKAAADQICGANDDDGVAKWIEENVL